MGGVFLPRGASTLSVGLEFSLEQRPAWRLPAVRGFRSEVANDFSGFLSNDVVLNGVTTAIFFATDIKNAGVVGAGRPISTPIPPALALFLSGLLGIGILRRISKHKGVTVALDVLP